MCSTNLQSGRNGGVVLEPGEVHGHVARRHAAAHLRSLAFLQVGGEGERLDLRRICTLVVEAKRTLVLV